MAVLGPVVRRIFSELMAPRELMAPATLKLIERFDLQCLVALAPGAESPQMAQALAALSGVGRGVGVWPLLADHEGYWPNDANADAFVRRVRQVLRFTDDAKVPIQTVVIDLEPPLSVMQAMLTGGPLDRGMLWARRVLRCRQAPSVAARRAATQVLASLGRELESRDVEAFATVVPLVLLDDTKARAVWQAVLQTPVFRPGWSRICPMLYTSILREMIPGATQLQARGLARAFAELAVGHSGSKAAAAVGLAGPGKLGVEPLLQDPEELALDVEAMVSAGVQDLSLFALEGVLSRDAPEAWLRAFTGVPPCRPPDRATRSWRRRLMWGQVPSYLTRMLAERV